MKEKDINNWIKNGAWQNSSEPKPDQSIDMEQFAIQYQKQPQRWNEAFKFMFEQDLTSILPGKYELDGKNLFLMIDEYSSKEETDTQFESHRIYADIQYVIKGSERIGLLPLDQTKIKVDYDDQKDLMFLMADSNPYRVASSESFFIFFPSDAHRPCMKNEKIESIKKMVIKVKLED